jgi:hypothetical protein
MKKEENWYSKRALNPAARLNEVVISIMAERFARKNFLSGAIT